MSQIIKIHKVESKEIKNGVVIKHEESIIDGSKGLSFKLFDQKGDKKEKYYGKSNTDGTFNFVMILDNQKNEIDKLTLVELIEELKKIKGFKFVIDYLGSIKQKGGKSIRSVNNCIHGTLSFCPYDNNNLFCPFSNVFARTARTARTSRVSKLKRSTTMPKKSSRKGSRKNSRTNSRKGSKKHSRKTSRKTSRKNSRKNSRK